MQGQPITGDTMLPDLIRRFPSARGVLDRYGLRGCGGPEGPRETVAWFARLHGVPLEQLLRELSEAAGRGDGTPARVPFPADTIYRPFFLAGLAVVLTLGCSWGAINLFLIGRSRDFAGADYSWVLAHGNAMVFGFVGLFIMGFAYQAFPRFKHSTLARPAVALGTLPLMLAGILLETAGHLMAPRGGFLILGVLGGLLQLASVALFCRVLRETFLQAAKREVYDPFVISSGLWFLLAAAATPAVFWLFENAPNREQFLRRVAAFNVPYRDVQLLGVAVMMILGVSLRFLPHAYGFREPSAAWRRFLLWGLNGAVALSAGTFLAAMLTGRMAWLAGPQIASLLLLAAAAGTPRQYRLFGPVPQAERDRGLKFVRAAYAWFIIAAAMLAFTPAYDWWIYKPLTGATSPFSHAFFGAYRHALTVGFITLMIVGVSSKVVPTLCGLDVRQLLPLRTAFVLLNLGNALRVASEIATDYTVRAYAVMGASGFLEVAGLSLWAADLVHCMRKGIQLERQPLAEAASAQPLLLGPETRVADVLARYPESLEIFVRHGFAPLRNPVVRRTMARVVTLEQACRREGADLGRLLAELRALARKDEGTGEGMPVTCPDPATENTRSSEESQTSGGR
jgi:hypothetical protein